MIIVPNGIEEIRALYGDPRAYLNADGSWMTGRAERQWRKNILARCELPRPIPHASGKKLKVIWCHKFAVEGFREAFTRIDDAGAWSKIKTFDGCYAFRAKRGMGKLSTHSWGIAVDLNRRTNRLGKRPTMPSIIVDCFESVGFRWGGRWKRPDGMHFQLATGY